MAPNGVIGLVALAVEAVKLSGDVEPIEALLTSSKLKAVVSMVKKLDVRDGHDSECEKDPYLSYSSSPPCKKSMVVSMHAPSKLLVFMVKVRQELIGG